MTTEHSMKAALDGTFIRFTESLNEDMDWPFISERVAKNFVPDYNLPKGSSILRTPIPAAPGKGGVSGVKRIFTEQEIQYIKDQLAEGVPRRVLQKSLKMGGCIFTRALEAAGYKRHPCTRPGYPGYKGGK